jgi:hypothetical protein
VWIQSMKKEYNRPKYNKVQRLISLRIAQAYRMISHEAHYPDRDTTINIKAEEAVTLYNITAGRNIQKYQIDKEENPRNWLHPRIQSSLTTPLLLMAKKTVNTTYRYTQTAAKVNTE